MLNLIWALTLLIHILVCLHTCILPVLGCDLRPFHIVYRNSLCGCVQQGKTTGCVAARIGSQYQKQGESFRPIFQTSRIDTSRLHAAMSHLVYYLWTCVLFDYLSSIVAMHVNRIFERIVCDTYRALLTSVG